MGTLAIVNPRRRRKARKARRAKRHARRSHPLFRKRRRARRRNPVPMLNSRRRRRGRRHNPIGKMRGMGGGIVRRVKSVGVPAAWAAAGAVTLDLAWSFVGGWIPATLQVGAVRHLTKFAGAVLLGAVAEKVVRRDHAHLIAVGAGAVVLYNAARELMTQYLPASISSRLGDAGDDFPRLSMYADGTGYPSIDQSGTAGMGYYGSAQTADGLGVYADGM